MTVITITVRVEHVVQVAAENWIARHAVRAARTPAPASVEVAP